MKKMISFATIVGIVSLFTAIIFLLCRFDPPKSTSNWFYQVYLYVIPLSFVGLYVAIREYKKNTDIKRFEKQIWMNLSFPLAALVYWIVSLL